MRIRSILIACISGASAFSPILDAAPTVFWVSSPVRPDETVYLQGDGLTKDVRVEYARLPDEEPGSGLKTQAPADPLWTPVTPLQANGDSLTVVLPAQEKLGAFRFRLSEKGHSAVTEVNVPNIWWTQGEGGKGKAYVGGWLRVFGRALFLGDKPARLVLKSGDRTISLAEVRKGDGYSLSADLPKDLPTGRYGLAVHNGYGGPSAWRNAGELTIVEAPAWPDRVFDVTKFGAVPNDEKDDADGIQAAMDAAGKVGGGTVLIPRGRYMVSRGLVIPEHVTLRGESQIATALQWYEYGVGPLKPGSPSHVLQSEPPLALIKGEGWFRISDITLHAWSHYNAIWSQHWNGKGNVHLNRVRIMAEENETNAARFFGDDFTEHRARALRAKDMWRAAFHAGGPNISVEDCDFDRGQIILDRCDGAVIRNNTTDGAFFKGTNVVILEGNVLHRFWPGTHDSCQDPLRRRNLPGVGRKVNSSAQYFYMARNKVPRAYAGDREASSIDSHGPFGIYLGPVAGVAGNILALNETGASGQKLKGLAPVGYGAYIIDGKGAGQYRRVVGGTGTRIELDRPFEVAPGADSVVSVAKYNGELLYIENEFQDSGDVQVWGGAVNTVFKGTRFNRCGGFNQAGGFIFGGVIPIWRLEQLDTHVIDGNSPGGPPFRLRDTQLSMNTYRHAEFYTGPCVMGAILRRALGENATSIQLVGAVRGALVEHCTLKNNDRGLVVSSKASYYKDPGIEKERRSPSEIVLRQNSFENIEAPISGDAAGGVLLAE